MQPSRRSSESSDAMVLKLPKAHVRALLKHDAELPQTLG